jgi:hypothetical protein
MILTRQQAIAQNAARYFTGNACINGHVTERYTANKTCCECANATANKTKAKDRQKYVASSTNWQRLNPDRVAIHTSNFVKNNRAKRNLWTSNYRQTKSDRMPAWLNKGQIFEMESVYTYCSALRGCGLDYHVDHIVPLRGKIVSGLHVPWNLQVISGSDNVKKGNRFDGY